MNTSNKNDKVYYFHELYGEKSETVDKDPYHSFNCPLGNDINDKNTFNVYSNQELIIHNIEIPKKPLFPLNHKDIEERLERKRRAIEIFKVVDDQNKTYDKNGFKQGKKTGEEIYWAPLHNTSFEKVTPIDFPGEFIEVRLATAIEFHNVNLCYGNYFNYKNQRCFAKDAPNSKKFYSPTIDKFLLWNKDKVKFIRPMPSFYYGCLRLFRYGKSGMLGDKEIINLSKKDIKSLLKTNALEQIGNASNFISPLRYVEHKSNVKDNEIYFDMLRLYNNVISNTFYADEKKNVAFGIANTSDETKAKPTHPLDFKMIVTKKQITSSTNSLPIKIDPTRYGLFVFHDNKLVKRSLLQVYDKETADFDPIFNKNVVNDSVGYFTGRWNSHFMDWKNFKSNILNFYYHPTTFTFQRNRWTLTQRYHYHYSEILNAVEKNPFDPLNPYGIAVFHYQNPFEEKTRGSRLIYYDVIFMGPKNIAIPKGTNIKLVLPAEVALDYIALLGMCKNIQEFPYGFVYFNSADTERFHRDFNFDCLRIEDLPLKDQLKIKISILDSLISSENVTNEEWMSFNGYRKKETKKFLKKMDEKVFDFDKVLVVTITYTPLAQKPIFISHTSFNYTTDKGQPVYQPAFLLGLASQYYLNQNDMSTYDANKFKDVKNSTVDDKYGYIFQAQDLITAEPDAKYLLPYLSPNLLDTSKSLSPKRLGFFQTTYDQLGDDEILYQFVPYSRKINTNHSSNYSLQEPIKVGPLATMERKSANTFFTLKPYFNTELPPLNTPQKIKTFFETKQYLIDKKFTVPSQNKILLLYCAQVTDSYFKQASSPYHELFPYIFTKSINIDDKINNKNNDYIQITNYEFKDQKKNKTFFSNARRIDNLTFYFTLYDGEDIKQDPNKVLPFKNFLFTIKAPTIGRKRKMDEKLTAGKPVKFVLTSDTSNNALFPIQFSNVSSIKRLLNINSGNESNLKYVEMKILSLTIPMQTKDPSKNFEFMYLSSELVSTALKSNQVKTFIINKEEKPVITTFNLGYFPEARDFNPKYIYQYYKKTIYFDTPASGLFSSSIPLDNLNKLLDSSIDIKYLNTDELVVFKFADSINQVEFSLTPYFRN